MNEDHARVLSAQLQSLASMLRFMARELEELAETVTRVDAEDRDRG
jgi:hypothetical protein